MKGAKLPVFVSSLLVVLGFLAAAPSGLAQHPPYIYIWSPTNGAMYLAPANLTLYVRAVGNTNPVQTVQFFAGDASLGVVTNLPGVLVTNVEPLYPLAWSNVLAGNYALKAVATDVMGLSATSSVVNISVVTNLPPPPVVRPSVYIYSPLNGSLYLAPANLTLYARAVETAGTVQTVEFFAGDTSVGVVSNSSQVVVSNISTAPLFPLAWSNVGDGNYALKAVATDAKGITATSSVVNITAVTNVGNVALAVRLLSPTNGQTYTALARIALYAQAMDSNVVQAVQFFAGTTSLGTVTNTRGILLTNWSTASSFSLVWSNATPGSYPLTAVATDTAGVMATSPPVNVTVLWPPPPAVGMAYPTNGQTFYTPVNIGVHARVADMYAPVLTMQYFANGTSIGLVTNSQGLMVTNLNSSNPFFLNWSNVTAGVYALTAVATDSLGLMGTSAPVTITVLSPPPPPPVPPYVYIYSPTNGAKYLAPANLTLYARAGETTGMVQTVEFFAGTNSLGVVSNSSQVVGSAPLFSLGWSNVLVGNYELRAIATDARGLTATSSVVRIYVITNPPPPNVPLAVGFYYPTNGQTFTAPANIGVHAWVVDSNLVRTVQYFAGTNSIGIVSNTAGVLLTNTASANPFFLLWSNVQAGAYALTAVATDSGGNVATSAPVNITVLSPPPPPPVFPYVYIYSPPNGATYIAPANLTLYARAFEPTGTVQTVEFFAGTNSLGVVPNSSQVVVSNLSSVPLFPLGWSNVSVGNYELRAVATDSQGMTATSTVVRVYVTLPPTNRPPEVRIISPPNAAAFRSPVNVPIYAYAHDADGYVTSVEFFAGTNSLGFGSTIGYGTNHAPSSYYTNIFSITWSNPPVDSYALTAKATDNSNAFTVSLPVKITILPPSPPPPTNHYTYVGIVATDPVAIEGTNCWVWPSPTNDLPGWTNWPIGGTILVTNCGPKSATFTVLRSGDTNTALMVTYAVGGTATNGWDYLTLPGSVQIPAGQRSAMISVIPLDDGPPEIGSTIILKLTPSTNNPPDYVLSSSVSAEAVIFDGAAPNPETGPLADHTFHINAAGPNGAWFHVEYSADLLNWTPVCTNQVVNGSIDFIDPDASSADARFYRAVPESDPPQ